MVKLKKAQIQNLVGSWYGVNTFTIPSAGAGITTAGVTTAINAVLSTLIDGLGNDLSNTTGGNDTTAGLACGLEKLGEIRVTSTQDALMDDVHNSEVHALISRKNYISGLNNVTGVLIDFVGQGTPNNGTTNIIRYDRDTNLLDFSSDTGSNWGTGVDVSTLVENDCFKLYNNGSSAFLVVRRTAAALPGSDVQDVLTITTANYSLGFFSWVTGAYQPYYNTQLIEIDLNIPVIQNWESLQASSQLDMFGGSFLDVASGSGDTKYISEKLTVSGLNTISTLSFAPNTVTKTTLEINGLDLIYAVSNDFTVSNKTITLYPSNLGYNVNTTDTAIVKYFRT